MSAFIVEKETVDRVVTAAIKLRGQHGRPTDRVDLVYGGTEYERQELGQKLYQMNCEAVGQRYREENPIPMYRFRKRITDSNIQLYKSIQCLLYQCAEGSVYKSDFYNELEQLQNRFANYILENTPEYDKAEWA